MQNSLKIVSVNN